jgi:hypothetical protein
MSLGRILGIIPVAALEILVVLFALAYIPGVLSGR